MKKRRKQNLPLKMGKNLSVEKDTLKLRHVTKFPSSNTKSVFYLHN